MTREEAIEFGNMWLEVNDDSKNSSTYNFFQIALKVMKQELCEDAISRKAVLDKKELVELEDGQCFYSISPEDVEKLPLVTPVACIAKVCFSKEDMKKLVDEKMKEIVIERK